MYILFDYWPSLRTFRWHLVQYIHKWCHQRKLGVLKLLNSVYWILKINVEYKSQIYNVGAVKLKKKVDNSIFDNIKTILKLTFLFSFIINKINFFLLFHGQLYFLLPIKWNCSNRPQRVFLNVARIVNQVEKLFTWRSRH